jgi:hypothetical protein
MFDLQKKKGLLQGFRFAADPFLLMGSNLV